MVALAPALGHGVTLHYRGSQRLPTLDRALIDIITVNIILFELHELGHETELPHADPRARHILRVLRREVGDRFDAGLINGPRGKGTLLAIDEAAIMLQFEWLCEPPPLDPIKLIIGLPRAQAARRILQESTSLGVSAIHFVSTAKGEAGYASSTLWRSGEWRRHLIAGAQQAFTTRLPEVGVGQSLEAALAGLPAHYCRIALDNYEASGPMSETAIEPPVVLALGPEGGWTDGERALLRSSGFELAHLGERVLRTETACIAAIALVKAKLGLM